MNTRPPSNDAADIAKWQQERQQEAERLSEERNFREQVREFIGEQRAGMAAMREDITGLRGELKAHDQADKEQFSALSGRVVIVDQRIGAKEISVAKIVGIGVGVMGLGGLVGLLFWFIERASQ